MYEPIDYRLVVSRVLTDDPYTIYSAAFLSASVAPNLCKYLNDDVSPRLLSAHFIPRMRLPILIDALPSTATS